MIGIEFVKDKASKDFGVSERDSVIDKCFYNGVILLPTGVPSIRIIPPITIERKNLETGMDVLERAIHEVNSKRRSR